MLQARSIFHPMIFKRPAGTSRGILFSRETWFLLVWDEDDPSRTGIGECGILPGLSLESGAELQRELEEVCAGINNYYDWSVQRRKLFPSIMFGVETAMADLQTGGRRLFGETEFTNGNAGIPINGLIWMGSPEFMNQQICQKLEEGFSCIKIKIGALDFESELEIIRNLRKEFDKDTLEIRVDANGAFSPSQAPELLKRLSDFHLHSIEQPIKQGQREQMARLCEDSPLAVALDEELIGIFNEKRKKELLEFIKPQYIILKPGLLGGLAETQNWVNIASELNTGWWVTSALESNIGLNAIAQWTFNNTNGMTQGLGTGQLFTNNIPSPLSICNGKLYHLPGQNWEINFPRS